MILPFLLAVLVFAALLPILAPLLRGNRPVASRASFDQAVYRDQLEELDRDVVRGLITQEEVETARLEIQRRLLASDRLPAPSIRLTRSPVLALIVFVVIGLGSVGTYLKLGTPGVPDEPFAGRGAQFADGGASSLKQATDTLAVKLKQDPSNASDWRLYGRSLAMQGQWDQAEAAYRRAMDLGQKGPDVAGDHAEILVMQAGGTVTPAAEAAFRAVLQADPGSGIARYYLAIAAMQAGEPRKAIDGLQALLSEMPADSPLRAQLGQRITEAARAAGIPPPELAKGTAPAQAPTQGGGPDAAAVAGAANMTDEQRQAMIRGMVENLAAKQKADPENLDGWLRLGRAYTVLHETDKATDAFENAARLQPNDASIPLQEVRALLNGHAPTEKLPPRVVTLLKRVEAFEPEQPLVLWYLGLAAAQDGQRDVARGYWGKLLAKVAPGGDDARMIQSALDTLSKG